MSSDIRSISAAIPASLRLLSPTRCSMLRLLAVPTAAWLAGGRRYLGVPPQLAGGEATHQGGAALGPVPLRPIAAGDQGGRQRGRSMVCRRRAGAEGSDIGASGSAPGLAALHPHQGQWRRQGGAPGQGCARRQPLRAAHRRQILLRLDRSSAADGPAGALHPRSRHPQPARPVFAPDRRKRRLVLGLRARDFTRLSVEPADRGLLPRSARPGR